MRVAFDRALLAAWFRQQSSGSGTDTYDELFRRVERPSVMPLVREELGASAEAGGHAWSDVDEIVPDDFFKGCATGLANRYLDIHPDPRDCRLVAEAECAKVEILVLLKEDVIRALSPHVDHVALLRPDEAVQRLMESHVRPR